MWVGTAQRRGNHARCSARCSPSRTGCRWPSCRTRPGWTNSVFFVTATCVLAGECVAWLTARLHGVQQRLREHDERRFQALLAASSDTTLVITADGAVHLRQPVGRAGCCGYPPNELRPRRWPTFIERHVHPDDAGRLCAAAGAPVRRPRRRGDGAVPGRGPGRALARRRGRRPQPAATTTPSQGVLVNLRDVSERTNLERALTAPGVHRPAHRPAEPGAAARPHRAGPARWPAGTAAPPRCCSSTWTASRRSTTRSATTTATCCCSRSRSGCAPCCATATRSPGSAATSSPSCCRRSPAIDGRDRGRREDPGRIETPFTLDGLTLDVDGSIGVGRLPRPRRRPGGAAAAGRRGDVRREGGPSRLCGLRVPPRPAQPAPARPARAAAPGDRQRRAGRPLPAEGRDAVRGAVLGVEALVRWQHPEHGLLGPDEFIPLAETTGLIRPLTSYVLDIALRDCRAWLDAGHDLSVAVNVSARCLLDLDLPAGDRSACSTELRRAHRPARRSRSPRAPS